MATPLVGIIMGSQSDWETMKYAADTLKKFGIPYEAKVMSAHRTPDVVLEYSANAESRGMKVIIAAAGGAATGLARAGVMGRGLRASPAGGPRSRRRSGPAPLLVAAPRPRAGTPRPGTPAAGTPPPFAEPAG